MIPRHATPASLLALAALAVPTLAQPQPIYHITDLGTLPGYLWSKAASVNDAGQVVGICERTSPVTENQPFIWDAGVMSAVPVASGQASFAYGINNAGQIVGTRYVAYNTAQYRHGYVHDLSTGITTDYISRTEGQTITRAINDLGQVGGRATTFPPYEIHLGLWPSAGSFSINGPNDANALITAVNDTGIAVGNFGVLSATGTWNRAHAWNLATSALTPLPAFTGDWGHSEARAVNDAGQIVGGAEDRFANTWHACIWDGGTLTDLGVLDPLQSSVANGINNLGQVVGTNNGTAYYGRALLWQNGQIYSLTDCQGTLAPWLLTDATAISDTGLIVGVGYPPGSVYYHAFLLKPCQADYNRDGFVDGIDYDAFNNDFADTDPAQQINADYNGDGFVDGIDYDLFNNDFAIGC